MKKLIILIALVLSISTVSYSQQNQNSNKITVDVNDLTPEQFAKIKADQELKQLSAKVATYGKWVGVGSEVGSAIRESLMAVVDVSEKFGETNVGKFTIIMVAWKIMGVDVVKIFLGLFFLIIFVYVLLNSYKSYIPRRIKIKSNGLKFWLPTEYKIVQPEDFDGLEFVKILHIFLLGGGIGLTYAIMFS